MAARTAEADVLLFPSLREGFGLPIVEAFATGVPVITSDYGAMAEIAGDAAILEDPTSPSALADAVIAVLNDRSVAAKLVERGRKRSLSFTWSAAAERTVEIYRLVSRKKRTSESINASAGTLA